MQNRPPRAGKTPEETLDPEDWADARAVAHRAVDDAIAYLRDIRDRPVWRDMPGEVRRTFAMGLMRCSKEDTKTTAVIGRPEKSGRVNLASPADRDSNYTATLYRCPK